MALIKCSECGKEISDKSKACIGCGCPVKPKCPECGKEIDNLKNICSSCGYEFKKEEIDNFQEPKQRNLGLAISGMICSFVGLVLINPFALFSILGIIFGSIAVATNPKEKKELSKAIWKYDNKARGFGLASLSSGICGLILFLVNIIVFISGNN